MLFSLGFVLRTCSCDGGVDDLSILDDGEGVSLSKSSSANVLQEVKSLAVDVEAFGDSKVLSDGGLGITTKMGGYGLDAAAGVSSIVGAGKVGDEGDVGGRATAAESNDESERLSVLVTMDNLTTKKGEKVLGTEAIIKSSSSTRDREAIVKETVEKVSATISLQFEILVQRRKGYEELLVSLNEENSESRRREVRV